jgi:hypothetical protein
LPGSISPWRRPYHPWAQNFQERTRRRRPSPQWPYLGRKIEKSVDFATRFEKMAMTGLSSLIIGLNIHIAPKKEILYVYTHYMLYSVYIYMIYIYIIYIYDIYIYEIHTYLYYIYIHKIYSINLVSGRTQITNHLKWISPAKPTFSTEHGTVCHREKNNTSLKKCDFP